MKKIKLLLTLALSQNVLFSQPESHYYRSNISSKTVSFEDTSLNGLWLCDGGASEYKCSK